MKRNNKKGFTIVELVIVIAIIAILAAVLIPTFSSLIKRANVSKDQQLVRNLNTALIADKAINGKHETMTAALNAVKESGFDVATINSKKASDNEILWDSENDIFCYLNDGKIEYLPENKGTDFKELVASSSAYWCVVNATEKPVSCGRNDKNWSVYLASSIESEITVSTGVDVGNCDNITSVIYENTTGTKKDVVIRTNSANTNLTINAEHDTVNHYGSVGRVDAQKIDMNCYNEYGKAAYIKVTEGKVVAKNGGEIKVVYAANTDTSKVEVTKETGGSIETGLTIVKPVSVSNEAINRATEKGIFLAYSVDGNTATTDEINAREAAVEVIAVDVIETAVEKEAVEADESDFWIVCHADAFAAGDGTVDNPYIIKTARQLSLLAYNVNTLKAGYASAYYKLEKDIDLSGKAWTPIGTKNDATTVFFTGHFDGNGHSIIGLTNNDKTDVELGLYRDELSSVKGLAASYGLFGFTQNVNISDLTMESASIDGPNHFKEAGIIIGMATGSTTMTNCTVDGDSSISGKSKIGGLIGYVNLGDSDNGLGGNVNLTNCDFAGAVTVSVDRAGALVGAFCAHQSGYNLGHTHVFKDCDSTGTVSSGAYGTGLIGFFYQGSAVNTYGIKTITFDNCTANVTKFSTTENNAKYIGRLDSYTTALIIKNDSYATNIIGDLHSGASLILKVENNIYGYQNNGGNDLLPSLTGNEETYKLGQMITNAPSGSWHEYWKTDRIGELVQKDTLFKIDPSSIDLSTGELKYGAGWYDTHISDFSSYVADGYHIEIPDTHSVLETVDKDNKTIYHYIYQVVAD